MFQSHQARIATLYLPLFGLLIENVQRINVRDVSPFPVNPGSVRACVQGTQAGLVPMVALSRCHLVGKKMTDMHPPRVRGPEIQNQGGSRVASLGEDGGLASPLAAGGCAKPLPALACSCTAPPAASVCTWHSPWCRSACSLSCPVLKRTSVLGLGPP